MYSMPSSSTSSKMHVKFIKSSKLWNSPNFLQETVQFHHQSWIRSKAYQAECILRFYFPKFSRLCFRKFWSYVFYSPINQAGPQVLTQGFRKTRSIAKPQKCSQIDKNRSIYLPSKNHLSFWAHSSHVLYTEVGRKVLHRQSMKSSIYTTCWLTTSRNKSSSGFRFMSAGSNSSG